MAETPKGVKLKEKAIKTAIDVFADAGYFNASFQRIADEVGVSQSALFHHFKNKFELLRETLSFIVKRNHERVAASQVITDNAQVKLEKYMIQNFAWAMDEPRELYIVILLYVTSREDEALDKLHQKIVATGRERVTELLYMAERERLLKPTLDPKTWGPIVHQFLLGAIMQNMTTDTELSVTKKISRFKGAYRELEKALFKSTR